MRYVSRREGVVIGSCYDIQAHYFRNWEIYAPMTHKAISRLQNVHTHTIAVTKIVYLPEFTLTN